MNDRQAISADCDVLIIGAGLSGLAAGIRLGLFGKRVLLCERHYTIGGLNSFYRRNGHDYEVGLHAMTNIAPREDRGAVLYRTLRQLEIDPDAIGFVPQRQSAIAFPGIRLTFGNGIDRLRSSIAETFPDQVAGFDRVVASIPRLKGIDAADSRSAREFLAEHLSNPLLREMLLCPLMYYGAATPDDMPFGQFAILFRSIFIEGMGRPARGVRGLLKVLIEKFRETGGTLRLRCGIKSLIVENDRVVAVELDDGTRLRPRKVLSSAGGPETFALVRAADGAVPQTSARPRPGALSFCEAIAVLNRSVCELGHKDTIVFFSRDERFAYRSPDGLIGSRSGVVCVPDAFEQPDPRLEPMVRVTALADYDRWAALDEAAYRRAKEEVFSQLMEVASLYVPDFSDHVIDRDLFTPLTITRYTGRMQGAVYGSPDKRHDGATPWRNLLLCGTDQGYLGIVGSMVSGVAMAARCLVDEPSP
ncbi:MAG: NAD(P)/FAD-dependent oxidoreductase [Planctomycetota bacterium]|nr:MAG: NAD(P)/FAD-dependent oxidoreductase [Planctomycetota bacterium]